VRAWQAGPVEDLAGERYLRLLIEHILATGDPWADGPRTLQHAGAALVAVGAVSPDVVETLRGDLALCLALRRPAPEVTQLAAAVVVPAPELGAEESAAVASPRAVATGPNRFDTPEGMLVVESVSFGPDGATIVETLDAGHGDLEPGPTRPARRSAPGTVPGPEPFRTAGQRSVMRHQRWRGETGGAGDHRSPTTRAGGPGLPPRQRPVGAGREQLRITDDRGNEYRRGPGESGGGGGRWRWVSALEPVPDADTAWLSVALADSGPFRLAVTAPGGVARGRPVSRSPGASWLLGALEDAVARALEDHEAPRTDAIADGVAALLALGWLVPSEPLLEQLGVLESYPERAEDLDPRLGSPLAGRDRRPADRPATLPLARLVDLGTRAARLDVATVGAGGLRVCGWFSPWPSGRPPHDACGWRIAGYDDRHNHYVATVGERYAGPAGADVVWELRPALDPAARSLRLAVAGPTLEASVEVVVE
jgi:hypothetical protein